MTESRPPSALQFLPEGVAIVVQNSEVSVSGAANAGVANVRIARPKVLISAFLATSAFYCFVIGRDRYTSVSEFVIQQAAPLNTSSASVLAGAAAAPQVLTSLVDGQYLQVYLASSDVKTRLFPDAKKLEQDYRINLPDLWAGLPSNSSAPEQLYFYRKQLSVSPQLLSGSVILRTSGFTLEQVQSNLSC